MKKILLTFTLFIGMCFLLIACTTRVEEVTVTYHTNLDTSSIVEKNYELNSTIQSIDLDLEKEGFEFGGWYLDEEFTTEVKLPYTIKKDTHFYAQWKQIFQVSFKLGDEVYQTISVLENQKLTSLPAPKEEGKVFVGWFYDEEFKQPFDADQSINETITLYGKFEEQDLTITFMDEELVLEVQSIDGNQTASPITAPTKEGKLFKGWSIEKDTYQAYDFTQPVTKSLILYAFYEEIQLTITFYVDEQIYTEEKIKYNATASNPAQAPQKEGYVFLGWYEKDATTPYNFQTRLKENLTLFAQFKAVKTYTVTFIIEGVARTVSVNENAIVTPIEVTVEGYELDKWVIGNTSESFDFNTPITQDITLTAVLRIKTFNVIFKDGAHILNTQTISYNQTASSVPNPSKPGYTFIGWSYKETEFDVFDFSTKIKDNFTIYAYYEINSYTVTFKVGNSIFATETVVYHSTVTPPADIPASPEEGKTFVGWFYDDTLFDFTTKIIESIELIAHFGDAQIEITNYKGYNEGLYFEVNALPNTSPEDYDVQYKLSSSSTWNIVDQELIRITNDKVRCDVVGLIPGSYQVKIDVLGKTRTITCTVTQDDRSGYAHFNYESGVGAYNNDGSLKSNAVVVYVTNSNKNTVKAKIGSKEYTGLANILKACTNSSYALNIRILGEIQTTQWNFMEHGAGSTSTRQENLDNTFKYAEDPTGWDTGSSSNYNKLNEKEIISKGINSMSNDKAKGITQLNGLTNQVLRSKKANDKGAYEYDSYYNMLDIDGGYNITIEGIGTDASIFQWGFTFKKCNSIEVKNLRFYNYTEDAVGFEGSSGKQSSYGNYWIHNCTFDLGVNNWDVCYENDKKDGDGSTDVKYCHNVTISYTQYNKTHKTNLIGSGDSAQQYNITLHHNFYNQAGSRLPLVRQANIHIYNNYYYKSSSYSHSIRANCFAFVENCYYEGGKNPYEVVKTSTYNATAIKSYNNIYQGVQISGSSYKAENNVTSRTQTVSGNCKPNGEIDYTNFDTNSTLFYYKNNQSDVSVLLDAKDVPEYCRTRAGVLKSNPITGDIEGGSPTDPDTPENPDLPENNKVILHFNEVTKDVDLSGQTIQGITFNGKTGKTIKATSCNVTLAGMKLTNSINVGGAGSLKELSVGFTISKTANITVYYANGSNNAATAGERFAMLCSAAGNEASPIGSTLNTDIVSYTFQNKTAGEYAVASKGSGLYIFLIVIEYLE